MDFIFMLTRGDATVPDCLDILEQVTPLGLAHIGFKDIGAAPHTLGRLVERIRALGATSYMEVVSETPEACLASARTARAIGVDRLLGGTDAQRLGDILAGTHTALYPFPGTPTGHPTRLGGSPAAIAADCARFAALGCAGADLLAYRATDADPLALIRAARRGLGTRTLIVAGSIATPAQIRAAAAAGADAFTIGTAAFDLSYAPARRTLCAQLEAIMADCPPASPRPAAAPPAGDAPRPASPSAAASSTDSRQA